MLDPVCETARRLRSRGPKGEEEKEKKKFFVFGAKPKEEDDGTARIKKAF